MAVDCLSPPQQHQHQNAVCQVEAKQPVSRRECPNCVGSMRIATKAETARNTRAVASQRSVRRTSLGSARRLVA